MFQRLFKWFFTIVGGLIGYEFFVLSNFLLVKFNEISELPGDVETWMTAIFVFIFVIISKHVFLCFSTVFVLSSL